MRTIFCLVLVLGLTSSAKATFSVVATDAHRREVGGAGASCLRGTTSVYRIYGSVPGHGVIHVQATLGTGERMAQALRRLEIDDAPSLILRALADPSFDPLHARRQYGVVDLMNRSAVYTGDETGNFAGDMTGNTSPYSYAVQGNLLTGPEVIQQMSRAFEAESQPGVPRCDLPDRLMAALEAGAAEGGDRRCSSDNGADGSFLQVDRDGEPAGSYLSLRVDDVIAPIDELRRRFDRWRLEHPCTPLMNPDAGPDTGPALPPTSSPSCMVARPSPSSSKQMPWPLWLLGAWVLLTRSRLRMARAANGS